jgi:ribosomal protein S21
MKVTIWKNDKESNERAITRFNKKVQSSRKLLKVRGERYHKKDDTKRQTRQSAIMREHYRSQKERSKFY